MTLFAPLPIPSNDSDCKVLLKKSKLQRDLKKTRQTKPSKKITHKKPKPKTLHALLDY